MATIKTVLRPYKNNEGKQKITIRVSHQGKTCYHPTGESEKTIQNLRDHKQIPYTKHGRKILYPAKGIYDFLKLNTVEVSK